MGRILRWGSLQLFQSLVNGLYMMVKTFVIQFPSESQLVLESIICVQKLERLIDLAKYFKLEIDPEVKTKPTMTRLTFTKRGSFSSSYPN